MKKIKNYFNNKVKLIEPKIHKDNRGYFSEVYNKKELLKIGIKIILFRTIILFQNQNLLLGVFTYKQNLFNRQK